MAVIKIVNDDDFELKEVSEKIKCLKVTSAESERRIFGETVKFHLGNYFEPYNIELTELMKVKAETSPDKIYSYQHYTYAKSKMNKLLSVRKFVEYVALPEMMTRFYMKIKNYKYHQATQYLYGSELYTVHHLELLTRVCI